MKIGLEKFAFQFWDDVNYYFEPCGSEHYAMLKLLLHENINGFLKFLQDSISLSLENNPDNDIDFLTVRFTLTSTMKRSLGKSVIDNAMFPPPAVVSSLSANDLISQKLAKYGGVDENFCQELQTVAAGRKRFSYAEGLENPLKYKTRAFAVEQLENPILMDIETDQNPCNQIINNDQFIPSCSVSEPKEEAINKNNSLGTLGTSMKDESPNIIELTEKNTIGTIPTTESENLKPELLNSEIIFSLLKSLCSSIIEQFSGEITNNSNSNENNSINKRKNMTYGVFSEEKDSFVIINSRKNIERLLKTLPYFQSKDNSLFPEGLLKPQQEEIENKEVSLGKRGRFYLEVWDEEEYLLKTKKGDFSKPLDSWDHLFQSYDENHDGSYRDMLFVKRIEKLKTFEAERPKKRRRLNELVELAAISGNNDLKRANGDAQHEEDREVKDLKLMTIEAPPVPVVLQHPASWGLNSRIDPKKDLVLFEKTENYESIHPACHSTTVVLPPSMIQQENRRRNPTDLTEGSQEEATTEGEKQGSVITEEVIQEDVDEFNLVVDNLQRQLEWEESLAFLRLTHLNQKLLTSHNLNQLQLQRRMLGESVLSAVLKTAPNRWVAPLYRFKPPRKKKTQGQSGVGSTPSSSSGGVKNGMKLGVEGEMVGSKAIEIESRYSTRKATGSLHQSRVLISNSGATGWRNEDNFSRPDFASRVPLVGGCVLEHMRFGEFIHHLRKGQQIEVFMKQKWVSGIVMDLKRDGEIIRHVKVCPLSESIRCSQWVAVEDNCVAPLGTYLVGTSNVNPIPSLETFYGMMNKRELTDKQLIRDNNKKLENILNIAKNGLLTDQNDKVFNTTLQNHTKERNYENIQKPVAGSVSLQFPVGSGEKGKNKIIAEQKVFLNPDQLKGDRQSSPIKTIALPSIDSIFPGLPAGSTEKPKNPETIYPITQPKINQKTISNPPEAIMVYKTANNQNLDKPRLNIENPVSYKPRPTLPFEPDSVVSKNKPKPSGNGLKFSKPALADPFKQWKAPKPLPRQASNCQPNSVSKSVAVPVRVGTSLAPRNQSNGQPPHKQESKTQLTVKSVSNSQQSAPAVSTRPPVPIRSPLSSPKNTNSQICQYKPSNSTVDGTNHLLVKPVTNRQSNSPKPVSNGQYPLKRTVEHSSPVTKTFPLGFTHFPTGTGITSVPGNGQPLLATDIKRVSLELKRVGEQMGSGPVHAEKSDVLGGFDREVAEDAGEVTFRIKSGGFLTENV